MKSLKVLTTFEYKRIEIADEFSSNSESPTITRRQAEELDEVLKARKLNCCEFGASSVKFSQYVGIIRFSDWTLEILPKVDGVNDQQQVRHYLVDMLKQTQKLPVKQFGVAGFNMKHNDLLEIYASIFCVNLTEQLRKGVIRQYQTKEDNLSVVRGRILLPQQIRMNFMHPEKVYCSFDEFCEDNAYNQLLKAALVILQKNVTTARVQQMIRELLFVFSEVNDKPVKTLLQQELLITRLVIRFEDSLAIAKIILQGLNPDFSVGKQKFFTLLFDMNVLFEDFIAVSIRKLLGRKVQSQKPCKSLLKTEDGKQLFLMRPDVTYNQGKDWILDTKWKLINSQERKMNISQADLYQMLAYAVRYGCQNIILLYPHHSKITQKAGVIKQFEMQGAQETIVATLTVATIDLAQSNHQGFQKNINQQLGNILGEVMHTHHDSVQMIL